VVCEPGGSLRLAMDSVSLIHLTGPKVSPVHMAAASSEAAFKARLLLEGLSRFSTMGVLGPTVEEAVEGGMDMSTEPTEVQASTSSIPHAPVEDQSPPPPAFLPELSSHPEISSHNKGVVLLQQGDVFRYFWASPYLPRGEATPPHMCGMAALFRALLTNPSIPLLEAFYMPLLRNALRQASTEAGRRAATSVLTSAAAFRPDLGNWEVYRMSMQTLFDLLPHDAMLFVPTASRDGVTMLEVAGCWVKTRAAFPVRAPLNFIIDPQHKADQMSPRSFTVLPSNRKKINPMILIVAAINSAEFWYWESSPKPSNKMSANAAPTGRLMPSLSTTYQMMPIPNREASNSMTMVTLRTQKD
jgi:hypothetical protein